MDTLKEEKTMFKILTDLERYYPVLYNNGVRRGKIIREFLQYAGIEEQFAMSISLAAKVSDIGMIYLDSKLLKKIEKGLVLNFEEQEKLEKSSKKGVDYLVKNLGTNFPEINLESILYQYERYDGTGRAMKQKEQIPGPAYIVALVREFDKNLKKSKNIKESMLKLEKEQGMIDPYWIREFSKFLKKEDTHKKILALYK